MAKNKKTILWIVGIILVILFYTQTDMFAVAPSTTTSDIRIVSVNTGESPSDASYYYVGIPGKQFPLKVTLKNYGVKTGVVGIEAGIYADWYAEEQGFSLYNPAVKSCGEQLNQPFVDGGQLTLDAGEETTITLNPRFPDQYSMIDGKPNIAKDGTEYRLFIGIYVKCFEQYKNNAGLTGSVNNIVWSRRIPECDAHAEKGGMAEGSWECKNNALFRTEEPTPTPGKKPVLSSSELRTYIFPWRSYSSISLGFALSNANEKSDNPVCKTTSQCGEGGKCFLASQSERDKTKYEVYEALTSDVSGLVWSSVQKYGLCVEEEKGFCDWAESWSPDFGVGKCASAGIIIGLGVIILLFMMGMIMQPRR